jgi:predicted HTH domain antitoxin
MDVIDITPSKAEEINFLAGNEMPLGRRLQVWGAISLYLEGKVSIGKAAEIAEMPKGMFEDYLADHHVPISLLTIEDVMGDLEKIGKLDRQQ